MLYVPPMTERIPTSPIEVKIKLKHRDWEVEITCLESKIKQVVEHVLSSIDTSTTNDPSWNAQITELKKEIESLKLRINSGDISQTPTINAIELQRKEITKGGMTCRGILETLWYEGYFGTDKLLGEVHEEISRRGYNYDRTAVSHSLTDMSTRKYSKQNWNHEKLSIYSEETTI